MTEKIITFENVSKSFGAITALENVNISVDQGEFLALVGPSGCGKSTILRIASGLDYPSLGSMNTNTKKSWIRFSRFYFDALEDCKKKHRVSC